jgi:hypothetical protein
MSPVVEQSAPIKDASEAIVSDEPTESSALKGPYFGQPSPGTKSEPFALSVLAARSDHYIGSVTFSPDGDEAYWPVVDRKDGGQRWIAGSRIKNGLWTAPQTAPFSVKGLDDAPSLSPDGKRLVFISGRPIKGGGKPGRATIWNMEREGEGWSDPVPLPDAVNSPFWIHQQLSLDRENNLYFGAEGPDGYGSLDIYVSMYAEGKYQKPENLGPVINSPEGDYAPFISPDGSYLIFTRNINQGWTLLLAFRSGGRTWTRPIDLKEHIDGIQGLELSCPFVTRDGKHLIFFGEKGSAISPFWIDGGLIEKLRGAAAIR